MEKNKEGKKNIEITPEQWNALQNKLKMLESVADKGRMFDYESKQKQDKKPISVKISIFDDKYIVGWRTLKFELGRNPATGRETFAGETALYEITLLDKEGNKTTQEVTGYSGFSSARYDKRVDCPVLSKKETMEGESLYEVQLPDGQKVELESRFLN